ncbi:MAG: hypothetical protein COA58_13040 [Bacteroidetes bacterium]|nr:MAG: hypothetical protein COA58_13040 [Bacteroidota bacterium]
MKKNNISAHIIIALMMFLFACGVNKSAVSTNAIRYYQCSSPMILDFITHRDLLNKISNNELEYISYSEVLNFYRNKNSTIFENWNVEHTKFYKANYKLTNNDSFIKFHLLVLDDSIHTSYYLCKEYNKAFLDLIEIGLFWKFNDNIAREGLISVLDSNNYVYAFNTGNGGGRFLPDYIYELDSAQPDGKFLYSDKSGYLSEYDSSQVLIHIDSTYLLATNSISMTIDESLLKKYCQFVPVETASQGCMVKFDNISIPKPISFRLRQLVLSDSSLLEFIVHIKIHEELKIVEVEMKNNKTEKCIATLIMENNKVLSISEAEIIVDIDNVTIKGENMNNIYKK